MSLASFVLKLCSHGHARWCSARRRFQRHLHGLTHRYRPEFHYMRGPGPKWREKHSAAATTTRRGSAE